MIQWLDFGIGKGTMLKVLRSGVPLHVLGDVDARWSDILEATKSMTASYGQSKSPAKSMSDVRVNV